MKFDDDLVCIENYIGRLAFGVMVILYMNHLHVHQSFNLWYIGL